MGDTIKVIRGVGPEISLKRLKEASAKLLVARIRGNEPHVSFTFVQRLLDEVIDKRRQEIGTKREVDHIIAEMAKDPELSDSDADLLLEALARDDDLIEPYDFTGLEITDLDQLGGSSSHHVEIASESQWQMTDGGEKEPKESSLEQRHRTPVLACSRPRRRYWDNTVNVRRVLVITLLAVFVMVGFVVLVG